MTTNNLPLHGWLTYALQQSLCRVLMFCSVINVYLKILTVSEIITIPMFNLSLEASGLCLQIRKCILFSSLLDVCYKIPVFSEIYHVLKTKSSKSIILF